jgi:formate hydrogenlyase subunit 6/NADH:ubiquinone oxidoreductase subunit I
VSVNEREVSEDVSLIPEKDRRAGRGQGLLKGLGVTLRTMFRRSVTQEYPDEKPALPARTRGVISLKEANCTVCYKCSRECPDWCIYIDAHKETHEPAGGGKGRSAKILDRFAIDFSLCMYCGICIEVCPFDALFWSPEYEYAEYDIREMIHERDRLDSWNYKVLPPPMIEEGAEIPEEEKPAVAAAASAASAAPPAATAARAAAGARAPAGAPTAPEAPASPKVEVAPDQAVYDATFAEEIAKGTPERVAIGKAKRAAMLAAKAAAGVAPTSQPPATPPTSTPVAAAPVPPAAAKVEVEPDQAVYDATFAEEIAKGTPERVAIGKAKRAAMLAARAAAGGEVAPAAPPAPRAAPTAASTPEPAPEAPPPSPAAAPATEAPKVEVEPDQDVYDATFAEEIAKGTPERVAIGKAKRAAMLAARRKAQGG